MAAVIAAADTARERIDEAWLLTDDPVECNSRPTPPSPRCTGPTNRSAANHFPMSLKRDLIAVRLEAEDLARHTRLLVNGTASLWQFADDFNGQNVRQARADFCGRQREAFARFGLDPLGGPAEEAARSGRSPAESAISCSACFSSGSFTAPTRA